MDKLSRKWLLTFSDVDLNGPSHDAIKEILSRINNLGYWCMCDEFDRSGSDLHTHLFLYFDNPVPYSYLGRMFIGYVAITENNGSDLNEIVAYVRKQGRYKELAVDEINLSHTFEDSVVPRSDTGKGVYLWVIGKLRKLLTMLRKKK